MLYFPSICSEIMEDEMIFESTNQRYISFISITRIIGLLPLYLWMSFSALAMPTLVNQTVDTTIGQMNIAVPQGWAVQSEPQKGTILLTEDANRSDGSIIVIAMVANMTGVQSAESIAMSAIQNTGLQYNVTNKELLHNGQISIVEATLTQSVEQAKIAVIVNYDASSKSSIITTLLTPNERYSSLGGIGLLKTILASFQTPTQPNQGIRKSTLSPSQPTKGVTVHKKDLMGVL